VTGVQTGVDNVQKPREAGLVGVVGGVLSLLEKLPDEESDELDMDDDEADDDAICACSARRSLASIGAPDSSVLMMLCVRWCVCVCGERMFDDNGVCSEYLQERARVKATGVRPASVVGRRCSGQPHVSATKKNEARETKKSEERRNATYANSI
jgi:hypothetical protein